MKNHTLPKQNSTSLAWPCGVKLFLLSYIRRSVSHPVQISLGWLRSHPGLVGCISIAHLSNRVCWRNPLLRNRTSVFGSNRCSGCRIHGAWLIYREFRIVQLPILKPPFLDGIGILLELAWINSLVLASPRWSIAGIYLIANERASFFRRKNRFHRIYGATNH